MKKYNEKDMKKGWFVGSFLPVAYTTKDCEVALKRYKAGEQESSHYHKFAIELTLIVSGIVEMNGVRYVEGDIIVIEPNETTNFKAISDSINVVVKVPSIFGDKYII